MIDPFAPTYAVLSQNFGQHLQDLTPTHPPPLNEAADHPHVLHHRLVPPACPAGWLQRACRGIRQGGRAARPDRACPRTRDGRRGDLVPILPRPGPVAFVVEIALLGLAFLPTVMSDTASDGLSPTMRLLTAKGTAQRVAAVRIAWMGQKENPAMPTPGKESAQIRLGSQNRSQ